jgi:hypothetical protein
MYKNLGESIIQYTDQSKSVVVLVAPFVKVNVIAKILEAISPEILLKIVTRWIPEEIVAGVNDLEIWKLLKKRPNSSLYLCQNLHAKYYRFDDKCLIGSANLTAQALGFKKRSNLELLLPYSSDNSSLVEFEDALFSQSILVNELIYSEYLELVEKLKQDIPEIIIQIEEPDVFQQDNFWLPSLRNPEEFYLAYSGQNNRLTTVARELGKKELDSFKIPKGLSKDTFNLYISLFIKQTEIVKYIDSNLDKPRRFGEVRRLIQNLLNQENINADASYTWQTLMRWLLYFLPDRYSYKVFNYSEIFYRNQE